MCKKIKKCHTTCLELVTLEMLLGTWVKLQSIIIIIKLRPGKLFKDCRNYYGLISELLFTFGWSPFPVVYSST